jgi:hypothetical protein
LGEESDTKKAEESRWVIDQYDSQSSSSSKTARSASIDTRAGDDVTARAIPRERKAFLRFESLPWTREVGVCDVRIGDETPLAATARLQMMQSQQFFRIRRLIPPRFPSTSEKTT